MVANPLKGHGSTISQQQERGLNLENLHQENVLATSNMLVSLSFLRGQHCLKRALSDTDTRHRKRDALHRPSPESIALITTTFTLNPSLSPQPPGPVSNPKVQSHKPPPAILECSLPRAGPGSWACGSGLCLESYIANLKPENLQ